MVEAGPEKYRERGNTGPRKGAICQEGKALNKGGIQEGEALASKEVILLTDRHRESSLEGIHNRNG